MTLRHPLAFVAVLLASPPPDIGALTRVPPGLVRIGVVLTTQSPAADLTLEAGTIVNTSFASSGGSIRVRVERNHLSFTHDGDGPAEAYVHLIVSGLRADTRVRWRLTLSSWDPPTQIEVSNENKQGRARLADRFDASARESTFESPAAALLAGGPVELGAGPRPLVLAFFYPWYQHFNWLSDHLLDRPLYQYSTELPDEVARSLGEARAAGLDGVIVSWGGDTDWNDRRLRFVLDQARGLGLTVSILVETLSATEGPEGTKKPIVADKMRRWLEKAFDAYTSHPAFLRLRGRPVVFVYAADTFTRDDWQLIVQSLQQRRRNILLMADSLDPALLDSFRGAFTYATAGISQPDLKRFYADQALRAQSYHLLYAGERRVAAATVSPGYDDTRLDRETTMAVGRANGGLYEAQWQAAVAAQPDWILVTSWNEFWENTHIEPSELFGRRYQGRTRAWSEFFRRQGVDGPAPSVQPQPR